MTIASPALTSVKVNPGAVVGMTSVIGMATLSGPAPSGGVVVMLAITDGAATLPRSVTVNHGATHATFTVKTESVATQTNANIYASVNGVYEATTLTINPPVLTSVSLSPTSVVGGKTCEASVNIGTSAPAAGIVVLLSSSSDSAILPASVTIPSGKTSVKFTVSTTAVSQKTPAEITASFNSTSKSETLSIKPGAQ